MKFQGWNAFDATNKIIQIDSHLGHKRNLRRQSAFTQYLGVVNRVFYILNNFTQTLHNLSSANRFGFRPQRITDEDILETNFARPGINFAEAIFTSHFNKDFTCNTLGKESLLLYLKAITSIL